MVPNSYQELEIKPGVFLITYKEGFIDISPKPMYTESSPIPSGISLTAARPYIEDVYKLLYREDGYMREQQLSSIEPEYVLGVLRSLNL